jgi:hypothetical protein
MEPVNWMNVISHSIETVDWTYAFSTLIIRFVGIFVVLGILQVVMQLTGRVFAHLDQRQVEDSPKRTSPAEDLTPEEAAAVAMALHLADRNK